MIKTLFHIALLLLVPSLYGQTIHLQTAAAASAVFASMDAHPGYLNPATYHEVDMMNPVSDDPLNDGLKGWWLGLPQTKGGSLFYDLVGGNHGVLTSMDPASDWIASERGYVLTFDDTNDEVRTTEVGTFTEGSYSVWVNANNINDRDGLINGGEGTGGQGYDLFKWDGSVIFFRFGDTQVSRSISWSVNEWHHVVMTWDASVGQGYIDGEQVVTDNSTDTWITGGLDFGNIDRDTNEDATGLTMDGELNDIRLYDRPITHSEVIALFLEGLRGHPRTLNYIGQGFPWWYVLVMLSMLRWRLQTIKQELLAP